MDKIKTPRGEFRLLEHTTVACMEDLGYGVHHYYTDENGNKYCIMAKDNRAVAVRDMKDVNKLFIDLFECIINNNSYYRNLRTYINTCYHDNSYSLATDLYNLWERNYIDIGIYKFLDAFENTLDKDNSYLEYELYTIEDIIPDYMWE